MPVTLKQQRDYCPLDAACWPLTPFGLEPGLLCWRTRFFSVRLFLLLASTAGQVEKMRARYKHACSMRILLECIVVQVSTMMQSIASKQLCLCSSRRGSDHPLSSAFGGARDRRMVRLPFFDITRRRGLFEPRKTNYVGIPNLFTSNHDTARHDGQNRIVCRQPKGAEIISYS